MTEKELEQELMTRIEQMEKGSPRISTMNKRDYIEVTVLVFLCLAGIVAGAFL